MARPAATMEAHDRAALFLFMNGSNRLLGHHELKAEQVTE
jgi:hypothetical protein